MHLTLRMVLGAMLFSAGFVMTSSAQSAERLALANKVLDEMDYEASIRRMLERPITATTPEDSATLAGQREFNAKYVRPELFRPRLAAAYAKMFSEQELRELIAFYASPTGKKLKRAEPDLANALQSEMARIFAEHRDEFARLVLRIPPDRQP